MAFSRNIIGSRGNVTASPVTSTLTGTTNQGDLILFAVGSSNNPPTTSASDTAGNTYTLIGTGSLNGNAIDVYAAIASSTASNVAVSGIFSGVVRRFATAISYSGGTLDGVSGIQSTSSGPSLSYNLNCSQSGELCFAAFLRSGGGTTWSGFGTLAIQAGQGTELAITDLLSSASGAKRMSEF